MKPKVAFFDFASCEGCQLQVVNLEEKLLDLIEVVEVVSFREAMKEHSDDYDIAFIEGSIQRPMDEDRLKKIRGNAKILVAMGACACIGGVNRLRNEWSVEEVKKEVYKDADIKGNPLFDVFPTKAVNEVVDVDFYIPGCPIDKNEFTKIVSQIAIGRTPRLPNYPVCVECKKNENICVFELGKFCLGPVTRAGCNAICPSFQDGCEGCRGFLDDPKMEAQKDVLRKYGIKLDEMMKKMNMFNYRKGVY
ncbi:MAG: NADH:ubiquinone oxidoreductase [Candidatus Thermoplasmatota archaeon]|nr:NADH:ubiquinone oxidoreductase [Candidatus Thermoplasmatota archaeon]